MADRRLARFAFIALGYSVAVVLFGAVVRASGSGAGCGARWPTCGEGLIPLSGSAERFVEFTHRSSSGIALIVVAALAIAVFRRTEPGSPIRFTAAAAAVLIANEALIGAALVLFEWVAEDASVARLLSITLHLVNTFFLLAALSLTAWFALGHPAPRRPVWAAVPRSIRWAAAGLLVLGALGAVTALGDTLFPPEQIARGVLDDLKGVLIVRLRWIHPILAIVVAVFVVRIATSVEELAQARWLRIAVLTQLVLGVVNVGLRAPMWMQLLHLFTADVIWILFVITAVQMTVRSREAVGV